MSGHVVPSLLDLIPRNREDIEDAGERSLELVLAEAPGPIRINLRENARQPLHLVHIQGVVFCEPHLFFELDPCDCSRVLCFLEYGLNWGPPGREIATFCPINISDSVASQQSKASAPSCSPLNQHVCRGQLQSSVQLLQRRALGGAKNFAIRSNPLFHVDLLSLEAAK
jgi:hypothetical protein